MSIGAIFTAVIVTSIIRAEIFEQDNDESSFSNTTQGILDGENSMHDAIGGLLESFNNPPEDVQSSDEIISSEELTTTSNGSKEKFFEEITTTTTSVTTMTTVESTSPTLTEPPVPPLVPKCTVQEIESNKCLITCLGIDGDNEFENELKRAIDDDLDSFGCLPNEVHLLIDSCTFSEGLGLDANWLQNLRPPSYGVTITDLTITRSDFRDLSADTFINGPFTAIKQLRISSMNYLYLRGGCFNGLTSLSNLVISDITSLVGLTGNFSLSHLSASLTNLEFTSIKNSFPITRLTGQTKFEKLSQVSFSQNNFTDESFNYSFIGASNKIDRILMDSSEITQLHSNMFTNCTSLKTISLNNNRLTSIPSNIFEGLTALEVLRLQNNQLSTLPGDFLAQFIGTALITPFSLHLQNNSWNCAFEILHLRNLILDPAIRIQPTSPICASPAELERIRIEDLSCSLKVFKKICKITCADINDDILNYLMETFNGTDCASIELKITNHSFVNKTLPQLWLSHLRYNISTLEIYSTPLISFGSNAFNSSTFNELKKLTYDGTGTAELELAIRRESFLGLMMLEELEISGILRLTPSNQALQEIGSTVKEISINNIATRFYISTAVGSSTYERLEKLKLNGNSFNESTFIAGTFNGTHKCLKKLYMQNSRVREIDTSAFNSFEVLIELHLEDNQIISLPDDLFVRIKSVQENFFVHLDNNPLNCSSACHLLPYATENVICAAPDQFQNQSLSVISCTETTPEEHEDPSSPTETTTTEPSTSSSSSSSSSSSTTPTSTQSTSTVSTTSFSETHSTTTFSETPSTTQERSTSNNPSTPEIQGPGEPFVIPCFDGSSSKTYIQFFNNSLSADNIPDRESITVYRPPVLFSVESSGPNEVKIIFERDEEGMVILYYPISFNPFDAYEDDMNDVQCLAAEGTILIINGLSANTVYTFCSLFKVPIFTPFQCVSHANNKGMPWLYEEQKVIIVTSLTLILLLALVTGIVMTYFLIRRMPTLIRGSKRVVIVNNRAKEVMILPRSNNDSRSNSYRKESVVTPTPPEPPLYLTPLPRQSIDHRPPLVRSNSDTSVKSYVSVSRLPPRFSQVYHRNDFVEANHMARHRSYSRQLPLAPFDQSPEFPPPLPRRSVVSASSAHNSIASNADVGKLSRSGMHHNSTFRHRPSRCEVQEENLYNVII